MTCLPAAGLVAADLVAPLGAALGTDLAAAFTAGLAAFFTATLAAGALTAADFLAGGLTDILTSSEPPIRPYRGDSRTIFAVTSTPNISAVLWDFGGVILSSPFEAFNRFESQQGLPLDTIRRVNATNPDDNAWAHFERSDISASQFDQAFANDAEALGFQIRGQQVLALLQGEIRPEMVRALDLVKMAGFKTACLTNNMVGGDGRNAQPENSRQADIELILKRFDAVIESSKVGCRKPEPRFYEIACEVLDVHASQCVFLDDLGINLKPAAAMGMQTIKVLGADKAIADLEKILGISLK